MKKFFAIAAAAVVLAACSGDRDHILKVYNWSDYIDESVLPEFEEWYKAQTGEDIKVVYQTFDVNETMLSKIEKGHEDYDVVCPSDYIIYACSTPGSSCRWISLPSPMKSTTSR